MEDTIHLTSDTGLSEKQLWSLNNSDAKINIWEGSVRSGKTYISLWRFLKELLTGPIGEYLMLTKTYDSFKRNILPVLAQMIGSDAKYYLGKRELIIWGRRINIVGCDDEASERKIRGLTAAGAYVDEATIIPESVFKMLISRCAMGGARIFATTNPDSPYHWLRKDYLLGNPDVASFQFTLEDNPQLKQSEKEYLKRQYKGLWYQRFIAGQWVQAEGAVYDTFQRETHVIEHPPGNAEYYIMGVDYGTSLACAFVLVGVNRNKFPNTWVEKEYYWDSKVKQRQKTDSEYADDMINFIRNKPLKAIYIDPSAASFKVELQKQGVSNLYDAQNEVLDGIRMVAKYLDNGTLKVCSACENLIDEIQGYVWDPKGQVIGKDRPMKQKDHACVTGDTLVLTKSGLRRIDSLIYCHGKIASYKNGKMIFSPYFNVQKTRVLAQIYELELEDGTILKATSDHMIMTKEGWKELADLTQSDIVFTWNTKYFKKKSFISIIKQAIGLLLKSLKSGFMSLFGKA